MTLKDDFQVIKEQLLMRIYDLQGSISTATRQVEQMKATYRIIEAEEKLLTPKESQTKAK